MISSDVRDLGSKLNIDLLAQLESKTTRGKEDSALSLEQELKEQAQLEDED